MEGKELSNAKHQLINLDAKFAWKEDAANVQSFPQPTRLLFTEETPKKHFSFPLPPSFARPIVNTSYKAFDNRGESDRCSTADSSDVEDNSDSQSDAGAVSGYIISEKLPQNRSLPANYSGSQSDTGFSFMGQNTILHNKSSPILIHQPVCKMRGYESDGSPVCVRSYSKSLPPIGVFWDIENCQVPKGRSAVAVVQVIREKFFEGHREAEFLVVCDVTKENSQVIQELNDAQVNLIHVSATFKNAADEKLRQALRRFAEIYESPAAIILITGDINFAADITDLRHRKKIHVILIHNVNTSESLILCANEHYHFSSLVENLPHRGAFKSDNQVAELVVSNLPIDKGQTRIKNRLKKLSDNCGGRVGNITRDCAVIRFPSIEFACRAQKRMDGEDVFGNKIFVGRPNRFSKEPILAILESPSVRRNTLKSTSEEEKTLNQNKTTFEQNSLSDTCQSLQGMYFPRNFVSSEYSAVDSAAAAIPSLIATQTGIGTANFYRNTPPPTYIPSNSQQCVVSMNHKSQNGWSRKSILNPFSGMPQSSIQQPKQGDVYPELSSGFRDLAAQSAQQDQSNRQLFWNANHETARIPGSRANTSSRLPLSHNTSDYSFERAADALQRSFANDHSWEDVQANQTNHSPIRGSVAPKARTPSPAYLASGINNLSSFSRSGSGDGLWSVPSANLGARRTSRTPSPYETNSSETGNRQTWTGNKSNLYEDASTDNTFHPIGSVNRQANPSSGPIDLVVTNLDQSTDAKDMKKILQLIFREHVVVLHVSVFIQADGNLAATVKVPTLQDAQYAISQLHRKKIGFKRIQISHAQSGPGVNPNLLRSQIVSLLQEVPNHRLPLFKFRELFESRYLSSISVSDMYKLRDVCLVSEDPSGRMVTLNPEHRNTPSPLQNISQDAQEAMELPYCTLHYQKPNFQDKGWAEQELATLPNVRIGLKVFKRHVHALLESHNGRLPLPSFVNCYDAQFPKLEIDEDGVPLEHLVTCVPGVELYQGAGCVKYLNWSNTKDSEAASDAEGASGISCVSPPLANQLALFSRELVDLLKTAPNCQIYFNRFIPAYHHHFGRQCRVADYGFTKLIQLLEALPHVVQVLGEGSKRIVTLSHRAQVRRFTSDLLRVLKSQYSKQVLLSEFPAAYKRVLSRNFQVTHYGVCEVEDLLSEIGETTVLLTALGNSDVLIAIPKREQTAEEIEKTKQFSDEVFQLLRYAPQCTMDFSKFIPYYHHHFGRQCRVADYGFTKLIELFEAIPHVVKISDSDDGERKVQLTLEKRLLVLGEQIASAIEAYGSPLISLEDVLESFMRNHGYALRPEDYGFNTLEELMHSIDHSVKLLHRPNGAFLGLVDQDHICNVSFEVRRLLWKTKDCQMTAEEFSQCFSKIFKDPCDLEALEKRMIIQLVRNTDGSVRSVRLTPLQVFARDIYHLLMNEVEGRLPLGMFESAYLRRFGTAIQPAQFGFSSVGTLLQALQGVVSVRGKGPRRFVVLDPQITAPTSPTLKGFKPPLPVFAKNPSHNQDCNSQSPDTVLKKLIRNLSQQASPAKQRICGERPGYASVGYRPLGFGISQEPLSNHGHRFFGWASPQTSCNSYSTFTTSLSCNSLESPLASPITFPTGLGGQAAAYPRSAPLPVVQPPHPSELPMPRLTLATPPFWNGSSTLRECNDDDDVKSGNIALEFSKENSSLDSSNESSDAVAAASFSSEFQNDVDSDGLDEKLNSAQKNEECKSPSRAKRKQRLAIQFNSPLVSTQ